MSMKRFWKWRYIIPAAIVLAPVGIALFVFLSGGAVMLLWNWVLPPLFGLPEITLLQAFGLFALSRLLFGRIGGSGPHPKRMTPEERERFRKRMDRKFGICDGDTATP